MWLVKLLHKPTRKHPLKNTILFVIVNALLGKDQKETAGSQPPS